MTGADLDTLIRSTAKKQVKTLMAAAKVRRGRLMGMAAKARDGNTKARYKHLAKSTLTHAGVAAHRLLMSAENTADAYKRAMAKAAEEAQAIMPAKKTPAKKQG